MRHVLISLTIAVLATIVFVCVGCGGSSVRGLIPKYELTAPKGLTAVAGEQRQVTCIAKRNGIQVANPKLAWKVTGDIGTIDQTGMFTATTNVTAGTPKQGTIEVSWYNKTASIAVTVTADDLVIKIDPQKSVDLSQVKVGAVLTFTATGYEKSNPSVTFTVYPNWSVDSSIGSITRDGGVFTAANTGTGNVVATEGSATDSVALTVIPGTDPPPPSGYIEIQIPDGVDPNNVEVGDSIAFTAVKYDTGGTNPQTINPTWSAVGGIGTITSNGVFTATTVGSGQVKADYQGLTAQVSITVVKGISFTEIEISTADPYDFMHMFVGDTVNLYVMGSYDGGKRKRVAKIAWSVTDSLGTFAPADTNSVNFTAQQLGSGTITATYKCKATGQTLTATQPIGIIPNPVKLEIGYPDQVDPKRIFLGDSVTFTAYMTDSAGTRGKKARSVVPVAWQLSGDIGTLTQGGAFTGSKIGSGKITATYKYVHQGKEYTLPPATLDIAVIPLFNGTIAFIKRDSTSHLNLVSGDKSISALNIGVDHFDYPSWSPSGDMLALMTQGTPINGICTVESNGLHLTQLIANHGQDPAWSPTGSGIAYSLGQMAGGEIGFVDFQGKAKTLATAGSATPRHPSWSPDGSKLAFSLDEPSGVTAGVYIVGANGGATTRIYSGSAICTQWSPDGNKIAFANANAIYTISPTGGTAQPVVQESNMLTGSFTWASNSAIVYGVMVGDNVQLYLKDLATQRKFQLVSFDSASALDPAWKP